MKELTPPTSPGPCCSSTPKISKTDLRDASPTARLPRLPAWDNAVAARQPPPDIIIYEWLGDACLNFAVLFYPDISTTTTQPFAELFKRAAGHEILAYRCYVGDDRITMGERIKRNIPNCKEKTYSDYLEYYVGILLQQTSLVNDKVWDVIKRIVTVGMIYFYMNNDSDTKDDNSARPSQTETSHSRNSSPSPQFHDRLPSRQSCLASPALIHSTIRSGLESATTPSNTSNTSLINEPIPDDALQCINMTKSPSKAIQRKGSTSQGQSKLSRKSLPPSIAKKFKDFIFVKMIVDQVLSVSKDQLNELCRCRNVLKILMIELRNNLNKAEIELSLDRHTSIRLRNRLRILEDKICGYLATKPLESEDLYNMLRSSNPVRNLLEEFTRQVKTITRIGESCNFISIEQKWKIVGSDDHEHFKGSFSELCKFLLEWQDDGTSRLKRKSTEPSSMDRKKRNGKVNK